MNGNVSQSWGVDGWTLLFEDICPLEPRGLFRACVNLSVEHLGEQCSRQPARCFVMLMV